MRYDMELKLGGRVIGTGSFDVEGDEQALAIEQAMNHTGEVRVHTRRSDGLPGATPRTPSPTREQHFSVLMRLTVRSRMEKASMSEEQAQTWLERAVRYSQDPNDGVTTRIDTVVDLDAD